MSPACPPGYVVLEKKNKYGAFCEPKEGFPEKPKEVWCQFPGQVGDDCHCPEGTEFLGYKGCIPKSRISRRCPSSLLHLLF